MADPVITEHPESSRWEAHVDGELAGFAEYSTVGSRIIFTHTEVLPAHEGQGIGGALTRAALDAIRDRGSEEIVPICPFIAGWIMRHREYAPLVTPALRRQFEAPSEG
ncbi:GNAT family N-acetyltransferase [Paraconexibacter sp.]|uniref:GNAT family N-acetyltransferase n=1 Tax=Paraconexibacter sp. TaxID=2949640 RepID=UPI0035687B89